MGEQPGFPTKPSGGSRWTAVVVTLAALIAIGVLAAGALAMLRQGGESAAPATPTPSAAPTPSGAPTSGARTPEPSPTATTTPTAKPTPTPTPHRDAASTPKVFRRLARLVSEVRGLPVRQPLTARVVSDDKLADVVSELAFAEFDESEIATDQALLASLRLIPRDLDLGAFLEALYREQVLGLYSPEQETLFVATGGADLSPLETLTAAHEVQHALQDQSFDLEGLQDLPDAEADAGLALLALMEGDAVLTQQLWSGSHQTDEDRLEVAREASGLPDTALDDAPRYLEASLAFPYREGAAFVGSLFSDGGLDAVDGAFANPPTTTEQILHPNKYRAEEDAVEVTLAGHPGEGWTTAVTYTFGEFDLRQLLTDVGADTATAAAEGWGGGRVRAWRRGQADDAGRPLATAGALVFDSDADADEACAALEAWYREVVGGTGGDASAGLRGDRDWFALACDGDGVAFGLAPDRDTAVRMIR